MSVSPKTEHEQVNRRVFNGFIEVEDMDESTPESLELKRIAERDERVMELDGVCEDISE